MFAYGSLNIDLFHLFFWAHHGISQYAYWLISSFITFIYSFAQHSSWEYKLLSIYLSLILFSIYSIFLLIIFINLYLFFYILGEFAFIDLVFNSAYSSFFPPMSNLVLLFSLIFQESFLVLFIFLFYFIPCLPPDFSCFITSVYYASAGLCFLTHHWDCSLLPFLYPKPTSDHL